MTDADHLLRAAAWLRAFPHLPTMREGVKHQHAQWAETLERLAARLPRLVELDPADAKELVDAMIRHDFNMRLHRYPGAERAAQTLDLHRGKVKP